MNLGELRSWVLRTIKRPDKLLDATDAINGALEYITTKGDFAADLVEGQANLTPTAFAQAITISTEFPRFRKMKYLRPDGYYTYLHWKDPSRVFVEKAPGVGNEQVDVWYRAGDQILIKLSQLQSILHYGFYRYPVRFENTTDTYWILDQMSATVHAFAVALLYEEMGNAEEATRYDRRGERFLLAHKTDKQDSVAHSQRMNPYRGTNPVGKRQGLSSSSFPVISLSTWHLNKSSVDTGEILTIPTGKEIVLAGGFTVDGTLQVDGKLTMVG